MVDVEIFLSKGEVHIFKKRIFSERGGGSGIKRYRKGLRISRTFEKI